MAWKYKQASHPRTAAAVEASPLVSKLRANQQLATGCALAPAAETKPSPHSQLHLSQEDDEGQ